MHHTSEYLYILCSKQLCEAKISDNGRMTILKSEIGLLSAGESWASRTQSQLADLQPLRQDSDFFVLALPSFSRSIVAVACAADWLREDSDVPIYPISFRRLQT